MARGVAVSFVPCSVVELVDRPGRVFATLEPLLEGSFLKLNDNDGHADEDAASSSETAQAFKLSFKRASDPSSWTMPIDNDKFLDVKEFAPAKPNGLEDQADAKEERVMLLEAWRAFEETIGGDDSNERVAGVEKKFFFMVKGKREIYTEDGTAAGQEEYYDYIFPEEQGAAPNLKILEAAYKWKRQKTGDE